METDPEDDAEHGAYERLPRSALLRDKEANGQVLQGVQVRLPRGGWVVLVRLEADVAGTGAFAYHPLCAHRICR